MDTIKKLEIDLVNPPAKIPTIYLVQGDYYTRKIRAALLTEGTPWNIPDDAIIGLRYRKPDGTTGSYDSLPDGTPAYTYSENTITLTLAPQVVTAEGCVNAQVEIVSDSKILAGFGFQIMVVHDPARPIYNSLNYFNWQQWAEDQLDKRIEAAKTDGFFMPSISIGAVETLPPGSEASVCLRGTNTDPILDFGIPAGESGLLDDTLTLAGYAADAKAAGDTINELASNVANKISGGIGAWFINNGQHADLPDGAWVYGVAPNAKPAVGIPSGFSEYGRIVIINGCSYPIIQYIDLCGRLAIYNMQDNCWVSYPQLFFSSENADIYIDSYNNHLNPPMLPNTEYQTWERWYGSVVYKKLIPMGTLGTANSTVQVATNIDATWIIGYRAIASIANQFTALEMVNGGSNGSVFIENGYIKWVCNIDMRSYSGFVEVSYVKV